MKDDIQELLKQRGGEYGTAWSDTNAMIRALGSTAVLDRLVDHDAIYAWISILNKLNRALYSPQNPDHWRDIIGYATLMLNHLQSMQPPPNIPDRPVAVMTREQLETYVAELTKWGTP